MLYVDIKKPTVFLFTDASVDPKTKIGYGAYLLLGEFELDAPLDKLDIKLKRFENTTSSRTELETFLWAFSNIRHKNLKVIAYTDSQNIITLKSRENKIKKNGYMTKRGTLIKHHELYKRFFKLTDICECDIIKVKGHKKSEDKDRVDRYFTLVDKASREALRDELPEKQGDI